MFIRLFFGVIIALFVLTILKVVYFEDKTSSIIPSSAETIDNVANEVGKEAEKVNDDILDEGLRFIEKAVAYFKD